LEWFSSYLQPVKRLFVRRSKKNDHNMMYNKQQQQRRQQSSITGAKTTGIVQDKKDQEARYNVSSAQDEKRIKDVNVRYKDNKRLACCSVPYRINNATKQCEFLLVKNGSHWTFPGGGWEHNESQEECVLRESWEESGIKPQVKNNQNDIIRLNSEPIPISTQRNPSLSKLLWIYAFHVDLDSNNFPENRAKRWVTWDEVPKQLAPKEKESRVWELASKYFKTYKLGSTK